MSPTISSRSQDPTFAERIKRCGWLYVINVVVVLLVMPTVSHAQMVVGLDEPGGNTYPNAQYYIALEMYREGNLGDAAVAFDAALHLTRREPTGRWIDAIPVHAMLGECFYQAGDLPSAIEQFDASLALAIRHRAWLQQVDWTTLTSSNVFTPDLAASWAGTNTPPIAPISQRVQLTTGSADVVAQIQRGGGFESRRLTVIDACEVLRGLATALYRRRIIFGPLAGEYPITLQATDAITLPQTATPDAIAIIAGVRACGRFASLSDNEALVESDVAMQLRSGVHPLTPLALLTSARIFAASDRYAEAPAIAMRAAAAASALRQPEWVSEAMLIAAGCVDSNTAPTLQSAGTAIASAHLRRGRVASILAMLAAADASLAIDDVNTAQTMVNQATMLLQRREVTLPRAEAYKDLLTARVAAARGGIAQGVSVNGSSSPIDDALARMMTFAQGLGPSLRHGTHPRGGTPTPATPRLFQLTLVGLDSQSRGIGGKAVDDRLRQFALDLPDGRVEPATWRGDHVDGLAYAMTDHSQAAEALLVSSVSRKQAFDVLVQSDSVLRARFNATLPIAGRVNQVRCLATATRDDLIAPAAAIVDKPSRRLAQMLEILAMPGAIVTAPDRFARAERLESLATQLAMERISLPPMLPPPASEPSDLDHLAAGTAMMCFVVVGDSIIGTLTLDGKVHVWTVPSLRMVLNQLATLLKEIGAGNYRVASRLDAGDAWRNSSQQLRESLVPNDIVALLSGTKRLLIIPDGPLWYLPFELLTDGSESTWSDRFTIAYSPTPGFALHPNATGSLNRQGSLDGGDRPVGIVSQLFFAPRDGDLNEELLASITTAIPRHQALPQPKPLPTSLLGDVVGSLVVFGPVAPHETHLGLTTPGLYDQASASGTLSNWMRFTANVPQAVILPGYRTAATNPALGSGRELGWTVTAMRASGVRSVVLSRWPVGGESTSILFREFLQELPHDSASQAWRRAVETLRRSSLDPSREPLLNAKDASRESLQGELPLFWSSYLLSTPL